ncbi:precorrin-6y C5,15-methyltransferase (decarboxylating) subunit CbiE [Aeromicrobium sp. CF4.19]|uniref:precorrin-6y C5,15-methyltransferase (decarboxylating) subunit CbiE n=1 Tax=Aeromicrobium sp. CF4.19 TaxID=3373082 RepID=UPI003EE48D27
MGTNITVVGIGADGWSGLDDPRREAVLEAAVVLGGERHLALLPEEVDAERVQWPSPLREELPALLDSLEGTVVALASGDPLVAGIGTTLVELLGPDAVTILPGVSSVSLAMARMRWPADDVVVLRHHERLLRHLREGARAVVLSDDESTPALVAASLSRAGYGASALTVLADLGGSQELVQHGLAASWGEAAVPRLNLVAVQVRSSGGRVLPLAPGLPDDAFEHDGQVTKRDVRASAIARLAPGPGLLWDVGAGAGSVGIEWARQHVDAAAIAVEVRPDRAERVERNALALGVPDLQVVVGEAPDALDGLPAPDSVFVGGGATDRGLLSTCWSALRPGGRIVVHGVTLETEQVLNEWYSRHGGELTRLHVEHAAPIGGFTGWTPARAVTQWAATKPEDDAVRTQDPATSVPTREAEVSESADEPVEAAASESALPESAPSESALPETAEHDGFGSWEQHEEAVGDDPQERA